MCYTQQTKITINNLRGNILVKKGNPSPTISDIICMTLVSAPVTPLPNQFPANG